MALYSIKQRDRIIATALRACEARAAGKASIALGTKPFRQTFDLEAGGYCNRFVRQVHEVALGLPPFGWLFGASKACLTLGKLRRSDLDVDMEKLMLSGQSLVVLRRPGDILGWKGDPGHIALYLGEVYHDGRQLVAENSSAARGFPRRAGTHLVRYQQLRRPDFVFRLWA